MNPLDPPRMTVLSDQPLVAEDSPDALDLAIKLGPIFDILRHPDTRTPLSVAVYGDWGSGKSSAMKWLEAMLRMWNEHGEHGYQCQDGKRVRPVWFYPWKYQSKDDVWRGLIAEVILASLSFREATSERLLSAFKQFGRFLGRSFLHVLSGMSRGHRDLPKQIEDEYERAVHPEAAYLNQFEDTLRQWIGDTIGDAGERMVIFIDDLDRCLPEIALQVLEALKLYLDIDDLIFVVGVDRSVIDQLIQNHYARLGLERDKSRHYLAKMFQVEVVIGPNEEQAERFLDRQLHAIGARTNQYWQNQLSAGERDVFRHVVLRLAERNPREIKRLLNSVLIHGAGALHVARRPFTFAQGMQIFLVRKILDERYTMGLTVDTRTGMEFFHAWSNIVRSGAPTHVPYPEDTARELLHGAGVEGDVGEGSEHDWFNTDQAIARTDAAKTPYATLLTDPRYSHLWRLLADRELGELMRIAYPDDTSALAAASRRALPRGLIRQAIARGLGKTMEQLGDDDLGHVEALDLSGDEIDDLSAVSELTELTKLNLAYTEVSDLRPLTELVKLEELILIKAPVSELLPLRKLRELRDLSLAETRVTDIGPLASLAELHTLNLRATQVTDLSPLAGLSKLEELALHSTPVTNLKPLHGLPALRVLDIRNTQVSEAERAALSSARPDTVILA